MDPDKYGMGTSQFKSKPNAARERRKKIRERADLSVVGGLKYAERFGVKQDKPEDWKTVHVCVSAGDARTALIHKSVDFLTWAKHVSQHGLSGIDAKGRQFYVPKECVGAMTLMD